MKPNLGQIGITRFVKDECANFDKHYECCLTDSECLILSGKRCGYFEKHVLGPPDYNYRLPGYDYQKLFAQYAEQTKSEKKNVKIRRCECGAPIEYRHRFCKSCRKKRAKASNRQRQQRFRFQNSSS